MTNTSITHISTALNVEWATIATEIRSRRHIRRWATTEPDLQPFRSFTELHTLITTGNHDQSIAATQALLRLAATEPLATRVLLQVMVPTIMSETYRSARMCRQAATGIADADIATLVFGAATDAVNSAAGTTINYPLRNLHKRMVKRLIPRRERLINNAHELGTTTLERDTAHVAPDTTAAELLSATLETAVNEGIVTGPDAQLIWLSVRHDQTSLELAGGDRREAERLRKRRTRARQRLINNRPTLEAALLDAA